MNFVKKKIHMTRITLMQFGILLFHFINIFLTCGMFDMNFSYFRTNKQLSMSRPTRSRSRRALWKIKGGRDDLLFREEDTE